MASRSNTGALTPQTINILQHGLNALTLEIRNAATSIRNNNLKPDFIFFGKPSEDAATYLRKLKAFKLNAELDEDAILKFIPRTLKGNCEIWFLTLNETIVITWPIFLKEFTDKFLPRDKQREIVRRILNSKQESSESPTQFIYRMKALNLTLLEPIGSDLFLDSLLQGLNSRYKVAIDPSIHTTSDLLENRLNYLEGVFAEEDLKNKQNSNFSNQPFYQENSNSSRSDNFQNQRLPIRHNFQVQNSSARPNSFHNNDFQRQRPLNPNSKEFHPGKSTISNAFSDLRPTCNFCSKRGHTFNNCYQRSGKRFPEKSVGPQGSCGGLIDGTLGSAGPTPVLISTCINNIKNIPARIDTGASYSFISLQLWRAIFNSDDIPQGNSECYILGDGRYLHTSGISKLCLNLGSFTTKPLLFRVAQTLNGDLILGQDFLKDMNCIIDFPSNYLRFLNSKFSPIPFLDNTTKPKDQEPINIDDLVTGSHLTEDQKAKLQTLFNKYSKVFSDSKGRTSLILHEIRTTTDRPITCAFRRESPANKIEINKQIDQMLEDGIITPSNSPWQSPVHLVQKADGTKRFCIDYRELNKNTVADNYPIPLIEDVLNDIRGSRYFSKLDLNSGFWQMEMHPNSIDKTAFICSRGKFAFRVLPFGLSEAPRNFQRLIDTIFKERQDYGLAAYLDDLLLGSDCFDEHLVSLEYVLAKLDEHNLTLKKKKCSFAMPQANVLGYTLNSQGLHVDSDKLLAIQNFPRPHNLKATQRFLGMASWHSKFIQNYSILAAPLHKLKRKGIKFFWNAEQEEAFLQIKQAISDATALNHYNPSLPCVITTDASTVGLGCMFSQIKDGVERPVCYSSRLLDIHERNYSAIELEALAVYWAVKKYKHYLEGQSFEVRTDHRPLQWLFNKKNPSARLTRWALFLQTFNMQVKYKAGVQNFVADALSRGPIALDEQEPISIPNLPILSPEPPPQGNLANIEILGAPFEQLTIEEIKNSQLNDPECNAIKPKLLILNSKESKNYFIKDNGILYRKPSENLAEKIFLPVELRHKVLNLSHNFITNSHKGRNNTIHIVKNRYFWPTLRKDVINYVKTCQVCQKYKSRNARIPGLLKSVPINMPPLAKCAIDLQGPFPMSPRKNRFLCVIVDYSTRFVELFPIKTATTKNVAECLVKYVGRNGAIGSLISDNGPQFISQVYKHFCKACGMKPKYISPFHPQVNLTERINRSIKTQISMYVGNAHKNWDEYLDFIQLAINSGESDTLGCSPFYLSRGFNPRLPWDLNDHPSESDSIQEIQNPSPFVQNIINAREFVKTHSVNAQAKQAKYYNQRRRDEHFEVGDLVLKLTHKQSNAAIGVSKKLFNKWEGPFKVIGLVGNLDYNLADPVTNRLAGVWHISQLKLYHQRELPANRNTPEESDPFVNSIEEVEPPIDIVNTPPDMSIVSGQRADPGIVSNSIQNTTPVSSNPLHLPFKLGWYREVVTRKKKSANENTPVDIYYYSPRPELKLFRSKKDLENSLISRTLSLKNFSFKPEGIYHEPQELIRTAGDKSIRQMYKKC